MPARLPLIKIGQIAEINPPKRLDLKKDQMVSFLSMSDVVEGGGIRRFKFRKAIDVWSGFTPFQNNDVLIAKITPCFENQKRAIVLDMESSQGFGSTEFHVLRANNKIVDPFFLYSLTLSDDFSRRGELNMVGSAGQKRVPADFIRSFRFRFPPLKQQKQISHILEAADKIVSILSEIITKKIL